MLLKPYKITEIRYTRIYIGEVHYSPLDNRLEYCKRCKFYDRKNETNVCDAKLRHTRIICRNYVESMYVLQKKLNAIIEYVYNVTS